MSDKKHTDKPNDNELKVDNHSEVSDTSPINTAEEKQAATPSQQTHESEEGGLTESHDVDDASTSIGLSKAEASQSKSNKAEVAFDQPVLEDLTIGKNSHRQPNRSSLATWLVIFFLLLIIGGSAGGGYWLWQQQILLRDQQTQLNALLDQASSRLVTSDESLLSTQTTMSQQIEQQQQLISQHSVELEQQQAAVQGVSAQLLALTSTTNDDWKLAEAHYLTRLAGQRLLMERDAGSALALLQAADEIVKHRVDPALFSVREQLADDIAALKLANEVDREGLFLSLSAIGKIVNVLPKPFPDNYSVIQAASSNEVIDDEEFDEEELNWWQKVQQSFMQSLSALKNFVRISHSDETLDEILSPQAQSQLQTSLRLNIENAQWALLREEASVYQESLKRVEELLKRYYPLSDQAKQLSDQLAEIRDKNIVQTLPDISGSSKLLGAHIEQLHKLGQVTSAKVQQEDNKNQAKSHSDDVTGETP